MNIRIENEDGNKVFHINGRVDTTNSNDLEKAVRPYLDEGDFNIIFDCAELTYISSSGLRVFLFSFKMLTTKKREFYLRNVLPDVLSVLNMTGFSKILTIK